MIETRTASFSIYGVAAIHLKWCSQKMFKTNFLFCKTVKLLMCRDLPRNWVGGRLFVRYLQLERKCTKHGRFTWLLISRTYIQTDIHTYR